MGITEKMKHYSNHKLICKQRMTFLMKYEFMMLLYFYWMFIYFKAEFGSWSDTHILLLYFAVIYSFLAVWGIILCHGISYFAVFYKMKFYKSEIYFTICEIDQLIKFGFQNQNWNQEILRLKAFYYIKYHMTVFYYFS